MRRTTLFASLALVGLLAVLVIAPGLPPETTVLAEHNKNEEGDPTIDYSEWSNLQVHGCPGTLTLAQDSQAPGDLPQNSRLLSSRLRGFYAPITEATHGGAIMNPYPDCKGGTKLSVGLWWDAPGVAVSLGSYDISVFDKVFGPTAPTDLKLSSLLSGRVKAKWDPAPVHVEAGFKVQVKVHYLAPLDRDGWENVATAGANTTTVEFDKPADTDAYTIVTTASSYGIYQVVSTTRAFGTRAPTNNAISDEAAHRKPAPPIGGGDLRPVGSPLCDIDFAAGPGGRIVSHTGQGCTTHTAVVQALPGYCFTGWDLQHDFGSRSADPRQCYVGPYTYTLTFTVPEDRQPFTFTYVALFQALTTGGTSGISEYSSTWSWSAVCFDPPELAGGGSGLHSRSAAFAARSAWATSVGCESLSSSGSSIWEVPGDFGWWIRCFNGWNGSQRGFQDRAAAQAALRIRFDAKCY